MIDEVYKKILVPKIKQAQFFAVLVTVKSNPLGIISSFYSMFPLFITYQKVFQHFSFIKSRMNAISAPS